MDLKPLFGIIQLFGNELRNVSIWPAFIVLTLLKVASSVMLFCVKDSALALPISDREVPRIKIRQKA